MKNILFTVMVALLLSGCSKSTEEQSIITKINLSKTNLSLKVGEDITLTASHSPSELSTPSYKWSSSNEDIVSVLNGKLQAKKVGEATITVTIPETLLISSCKVIVSPIEANSIKLSSNNETLEIGKMLKLTHTIEPQNTTNKKVTWTSSNTKTATVNNGTITALSDGVCEISISLEGSNISDKCILTINPIKATSIRLSENKKTIENGNSFKLTANIHPSNATNNKYKWTSSNECISIKEDGIVTGIKTGESYAIVETEDGFFRDSCRVTINPYKGGLYFDKNEFYTAKNHYTNIPINISVDYSTELIWSSSKSDIISINNGKINALAIGSSNISAQIKGKDIKANCYVHSVEPDDIVKLKANISALSFSNGRALITFKTKIENISINKINIRTVSLLNKNNVVKQTIQANNSAITTFTPIVAGKTVTSSDLDEFCYWKIIYQYAIEDEIYSKTEFIDAHSFADY